MDDDEMTALRVYAAELRASGDLDAAAELMRELRAMSSIRSKTSPTVCECSGKACKLGRGDARHGSARGYRLACRCDACRAAHTADTRARRARQTTPDIDGIATRLGVPASELAALIARHRRGTALGVAPAFR